MPNAAIIIPAHNRRAVTLACLARLQANGDLDRFAVGVVDDGSTDGTADAVRREFPHVTVLAGDGHLWWTGAMRLGMAHAFGAGAKVAIWLNDDCWPEAGALDQLVALAAGPPVAVAGPACRTTAGAAVATGFAGRRLVAAPANGRVAVDGLSGFCVAVPRAAWEKLGPPDARHFPHYGGDTAYTLAARHAGLAVVLSGDARVLLPGYEPMPTSPATRREEGRGWTENWRRTFTAEKSPFRLATQWHFLRLKYGVVAGTPLALVRIAVWVVRFTLNF